MKPEPIHNKRNLLGNLITIILVSISFGVVVYFVIVLWWFPAFSKDWIMLEGFASVISLSIVTGGLVFAATEYVNAERAKEIEKIADEREKAKLAYEMYKSIFEKLTDPKQEMARRWILSNITIKNDDEDLAQWYERMHKKIVKRRPGDSTNLPEGQNALKLTLNCFDYIGFIADHYWEIEDDSLDWISPPIAKVWRRIGPYVSHVRTLRNAKDYYVSAEHIGNICMEWRQERGLPDEEYVAKTP
ncbi:MAG: hypothetical protein C4583_13115 [Anaerolineaceae bacterium]|nr:MAG: hypothetical protein C4583_13115 [Anaerolineaceae bacterium]